MDMQPVMVNKGDVNFGSQIKQVSDVPSIPTTTEGGMVDERKGDERRANKRKLRPNSRCHPPKSVN
jgi:hypothetical protein